MQRHVHTAVNALNAHRLPAILGIQSSCSRCCLHFTSKVLQSCLFSDTALLLNFWSLSPALPSFGPFTSAKLPTCWLGRAGNQPSTTSLSLATQSVVGGAAAASGASWKSRISGSTQIHSVRVHSHTSSLGISHTHYSCYSKAGVLKVCSPDQ